jgi:hypothetical protein
MGPRLSSLRRLPSRQHERSQQQLARTPAQRSLLPYVSGFIPKFTLRHSDQWSPGLRGRHVDMATRGSQRRLPRVAYDVYPARGLRGLVDHLRCTYGPVLAIPAVRRLLAGVLLAGAECGLVPVGVVMMVGRHFGSYGRSGLILAAFAVGSATWPVLQGRLFRSYGARRSVIPLAAVDVAALAIVLLTCTAGSALPAVVAAGTAGAARPALPAVLRNTWPGLVGPDEGRLRAAIALDAGVYEVLYLAGAAAGAVLLTLAGPAGTLVAAIVSVVAGTALFVSAGPLPTAACRAAAELTPATDQLVRPTQLWLLAGWAPFGMVYGAFEVVAPAFAAGRRPAITGMLLATACAAAAHGQRTWPRQLSPERLCSLDSPHCSAMSGPSRWLPSD